MLNVRCVCVYVGVFICVCGSGCLLYEKLTYLHFIVSKSQFHCNLDLVMMFKGVRGMFHTLHYLGINPLTRCYPSLFCSYTNASSITLKLTNTAGSASLRPLPFTPGRARVTAAVTDHIRRRHVSQTAHRRLHCGCSVTDCVLLGRLHHNRHSKNVQRCAVLLLLSS